MAEFPFRRTWFGGGGDKTTLRPCRRVKMGRRAPLSGHRGNTSRLNNRLLSRLPGRSAVYLVVVSCVISRCFFSVCQWAIAGSWLRRRQHVAVQSNPNRDIAYWPRKHGATSWATSWQYTAKRRNPSIGPGFEKAMRPSCRDTRQNRGLAA